MFRKLLISRTKIFLTKPFNAKYLWIFFLPIAFSGCEFNPSEIPETPIEPPGSNPPVLFIEVKPDMDTLKLGSDVWAEFNFKSPEAPIRQVRVVFDELTVYEGEYNPQYLPKFFIATGSYTEGLHHFTIQAFTGSNTGSIADKVGAEGYLFEVKWPVTIKHNVSKWLNIKGIRFRNGEVIVEWEKYDYYDFRFYQVNKWSSITQNKVGYTISNANVIGVVDTTYLEGEYADYSVTLNGEHGWNSTGFNVPVAAPEIGLSETGKFSVKWRRTQNPGRLGFYHLALKVPDTYTYQEIKNTNPNDTSAMYDIKPMFGAPYEFQIRFVPKGFSEPYVNYNSAGGLAKFSLGKNMPPFEKAAAIPGSGKVLLYQSGMLRKYDMTGKTVVDSFKVSDLTNPNFIRVSPNGTYFSYFTSNEFVMRKTADWSLVNKFTSAIIFGGNAGIRSLSISDNMHLVVIEHLNVLTVSDVRTGLEIFRKVGTSDENMVEAVINSAGNRILIETNVYSEYKNYLTLHGFNGNSLSELGKTASSSPGANYNILRYAFANNEVLLLKNTASYNYKWEERNESDFSLIKETVIPDRFVPVAIDFSKKQLVVRYGLYGGFDNSYSLYFDFIQGTSQKITPIVKGYACVFSGDILANGSGRYLHINDLIQK